jgi:hypothetical protein
MPARDIHPQVMAEFRSSDLLFGIAQTLPAIYSAYVVPETSIAGSDMGIVGDPEIRVPVFLIWPDNWWDGVGSGGAGSIEAELDCFEGEWVLTALNLGDGHHAEWSESRSS